MNIENIIVCRNDRCYNITCNKVADLSVTESNITVTDRPFTVTRNLTYDEAVKKPQQRIRNCGSAPTEIKRRSSS